MPVFLVLLLAGSVTPVSAGGPRAVNGAGEPMAWATAGPVVYHPDAGPLGLLSNAAARALLAEAFAEWAAGPADITFSEGAPLALDVNGAGFAFSNPSHYQNFYRVNADGKSPVIFDHDGSIIEAIFGIGARFEILGVAGIDTPIGVSTEITGASIIINGAFYDGIGMPASPDDLTLNGLKATMVHEIGHSINLDHTMLNHELALDDNAGNDIYVPTMFPIAVQDEGALADPNPDDELAAQNLYPAGPSTETIRGSVSFGGIPFQGANVVIRRTTDPLMSAWSLVSGGLFFPCNAASTCDPCNTACDPNNPPEQGEFAASHFAGAGSYRVCVEQIDTRFSVANDTFIGPLATPPIMPGPEECFDETEGGTQADDPDDVIGITPESVVADILLNALPSSDPFEPNNTLLTGAALDDLPLGQDTAPGTLAAADLDVFNVPVTAGQRVRIDIDAAELGSTLDAVAGFYDASNNLVALSDDAVDPDSQAFSTDPALELIAGFTGTGKVVVSSFPDLDQDGSGGISTGGYWLRVEVTSDTDGDGIADVNDICPTDPRDDADRDGLCFGADNCPTANNPTQDAPIKISGPMVFGGNISFFFVTPDDSSVIYVADQDENEVFQIYSVPVGGGIPPVRLNPDLGGTGKDVADFRVSSDGATVVYLADQDTDQMFEIYRVPVGGGTVTKLNGTLVAGGQVLEFAISPDDSRVVYRADQDTLGVDELYSVPIGGGTVTRLNGTMTAGGTMVHPGAGFSSFIFSFDSSTVVYEADQDTNDVFELYSVPIGGGTATKLNGPLVAGGNAFNFQINATSTLVLFSADKDTDQLFELYSVPLGGGTVTKLSGSMAGVAGGITRFVISADGTTAVYRADQDAVGVFELYSVPAAGGTPIKLNPPLTANGDTFGFALPVGVGDGTRMSYRADQEVDERFEIYSVPISGGTAIKLNAPLVSGGDVTQQGGGIFNSQVLFIADQDIDEQFEAYTVPAAGGTPVELTGTMVANGDYKFLSFDSEKVAVRADKFVDEVVELFGVRLEGGAPLKLNAPLVAGRNVTNHSFTTASNPGAVVYVADQDTDQVFELYSRPFSLDTDADGVFDQCDVCIAASDAGQNDIDLNGLGDACQTCGLGLDPDADGVCSVADNCPTVANATQADFDSDGAGNACDADDDNDGLADAVETDTGTFVSAGNTGTDPLDADSDNDGTRDGDEVTAGTDPNSAASTGASVAFGPQRTISTSASGAFAVVAADVDGDGDADVLSATETNDTITWYENTDGAGTFGSQQVITTLADGARSVFAADVDGDGDIDAVSASHLDDKIAWYENDGASPPGWTARTISTGADVALSVYAADVDGDGDLDVLSASNGDDKIAWYENNGASPPGWTARTITTAANGCRAVYAADVDGDGDMDALSASEIDDKIAWYENNGASPPGWTARTITTAADGALSVYAADVDGDGDRDVLSASTLDDKVAWYENDGASPPGWTARTITTAAAYALSVYAADVDGDGDVDAFSASFDDDKIAWYENDGASPPGWTAHTITTAANGCRWVFPADVDRDGDLDTLSASQLDNEVAWYENRSIHRNAAFPSESIVGTMGSYAHSIQLEDLDGDGDQDVVTGALTTRWHENLDGSGTAWSTSTVQTLVDSAGGTAVADLDRDGDRDILSIDGVTGDVSWAENTAGDGSAWSVHPIPHVGGEGTAVNVADIDRDGDPDVVTTMLSGRLSWHENTAGDGSTWSEHPIDTHVFNWDNLPVDLDGDGDVDVVNIGGTGAVWYENTSGDGSTWSAVQAIGALGGNYRFLGAGDLDGDGDTDVLLGSANSDTIEWYENSSGDGSTWLERAIATVEQVTGMAVGDVDGDGDLDVLSTEPSDRVVLHENVTGDGLSWSARVVSLLAKGPRAVGLGDVDGDGRKDVAAIGFDDDEVAWYRGRGGQFTLATASTAAAGILDGETAAALRIDLTSNGRAGDSGVELATLSLGITDGSGVALSSDEANALIERLTVHLDNGSGVFEAASDLPVTTVETLALSPQVIEFAAGDPRVRVAPGATKRFFVVVRATLDASAQSPNAFRVVHRTESSSSARDASTGSLLRMQYAANVSTPTITAIDDSTAPAVTGVFPAHHAVDISLATSVVLFFSEPVDPATAASGVALYAAGLKVPGRVSVSGPSVSIDPESPLSVATDYLVQVTPRLRDRSGNPAVPFVSTFDTIDSAATSDIEAGEIGESAGGATVAGSNADDNSGFAAAALGDVNATAASNGIADLIIGAPNTDTGGMDAGRATLIFGSPSLQSNAGAILSLTYRTATAQDFVGETVAPAGDLNADGVRDFLIGAPHSDQSTADAGVVYLVFGNTGLDELAPATLDLDDLASCAVPTLCGVKFLGAAANDLAGAALSWAGDINGDGRDDLLIGAPGATPAGRAQAGRVYLVYGPLAPGTIPLAQVGSSVPGLILNGETAGDSFGAAVSPWSDRTGDGFDDLLIGAPGATALDAHGVQISDAGYVYAIQGGTGPGHLDDTATPGVIEMSRVASGGANQVAGMVFIGDRSDGNLGRSVTGAVDTDGNGVDDILIAGNGVAFLIPGDDPKTRVGATQTSGTGGGGGLRAGLFDALGDFGAVMYTTGNNDPLTVGAAGDLNNDGFEDFIIGSPFADGAAGIDAGRAYVILGNPAPGGGEQSLEDVGAAIDGFIVEGAEPGDHLGATVGGGFDLNADGVDDGIVGAPFADTNPGTPANAGETYVISPLRPDEVVMLALTSLGGGITRIEWSVPDLAATYNVYRGLLSATLAAAVVKTSNMTQLACGITSDADADLLPDRDDAALPPAGDAWFYLVTAENFQGEGPLGPAGLVPPRVNDLQCP